LTDGFEVRSYRPGDEKGITELLQLAFGVWPNFDLGCSAVEHWKWKYLDNPMGKSYVTVAVSSGEIIGVNHAHPLKLKIGERVFLCGYASDTAVHPEFRRKGVYRKIVDLKNGIAGASGSHLNLSVTSNPIMIKIHQRNPTMDPFPHEVLNLVKITDISLHLRKIPVKNPWFMRLGFHVARLINDLRNLTKRRRTPGLTSDVVSIPSFDERVDDFCREVASHHDFMVDRGREYLNWRYCDPRAGNFTVRQVEDGEGRVLGYCVLFINRSLRDYPIGYLVDLLTLPERQDVAENLIMDAVRYFDSQKVNIINCLVPGGHLNISTLRRYGFLNSKIRLQLFCRYYVFSEAKDLIEASSENRVLFSYGDIDSLPTGMPRNTF